MKNLKNLSIALFVLLILNSCAKDPQEMIVGEWKITDIQTTKEVSEDIKEVYEEQIEELKSTTLLVIKKDGTFNKNTIEGSFSGNWKLNTDATLLTLSFEESHEELSTVNELTDNKLSTTIEINNEKNTFVYEKVVKK